MFQYRDAANFPWVSQAAWLYSQMVRWDGLAYSPSDEAKAKNVFRPDVYRGALAGREGPLPSASSKMEGAVSGQTGVGSTQGRLLLDRDNFFDGRTFDPDRLPEYLATLPG
jgi:NitT/TauT family transport system ATP-binding protein